MTCNVTLLTRCCDICTSASRKPNVRKVVDLNSAAAGDNNHVRGSGDADDSDSKGAGDEDDDITPSSTKRDKKAKKRLRSGKFEDEKASAS